MQLLFQRSAAFFCLSLVIAQKKHTYGVVRGQFAGKVFPGQGAKKRVRGLHQQATAIPGFTVGGNTATVCHRGQGSNCRLQKMVTFFPFHVSNKPETTVIPTLIRIVQTCFHRDVPNLNLLLSGAPRPLLLCQSPDTLTFDQFMKRKTICHYIRRPAKS